MNELIQTFVRRRSRTKASTSLCEGRVRYYKLERQKNVWFGIFYKYWKWMISGRQKCRVLKLLYGFDPWAKSKCCALFCVGWWKVSEVVEYDYSCVKAIPVTYLSWSIFTFCFCRMWWIYFFQFFFFYRERERNAKFIVDVNGDNISVTNVKVKYVNIYCIYIYSQLHQQMFTAFYK